MKSPQKLFLVVLVVCALVGIVFSGISTYDFIAHLDRQMHSVSCSFVPGLGKADADGTSGCFAVMMSPYSSVLRDVTWGGIPIALASLSVFAYLFFLGLDILLRRAENRPTETAYAIAATALPVVVSIVYFGIAVSVVGQLCKVCVGIYIASFGAFGAAVVAHILACRNADPERDRSIPWGRYAISFAEGVLFVALPIALFVSAKPAYTDEMARCGELIHPEDKYGIRVKLHASAGGAPAVELLDPLCPACKAFKDRLESSALIDQLDLDAVMFPLDKTCNWMVSESLHPGSCAVSEAVLCAGQSGADVVEWALDNQEELRTIAAKEPQRVYERIKQAFPNVADCVGKPEVRARINKSLRWITSNSVPVLTPQLYVRGQKVCAEDTDLGLEYVLTRLLQQSATPANREAQPPATKEKR